MGAPHRVEELGETQIPEEIFQEYLTDLAPQYGYVGAYLRAAIFLLMPTPCSPDTYNLLEHNCNTFSNEVAQLLTGNTIPSHITNLPAEVLETYVCKM